MPEIGEIRRPAEIGLKGKTRRIWHACQICGKPRWVMPRNGKPESPQCRGCASRTFWKSPKGSEIKVGLALVRKGKRSGNWRGGRNIVRNGYIALKIHPADFFAPTGREDGYILEHRLVMAKSLGRNLHRWEIVHHKNHIKDDNRLENLQLVSEDKHLQITLLEKRISLLEKRVTLLEAENSLLKAGQGGLLTDEEIKEEKQ